MNNELDTRISELRTKKARLFFEQQEVKRLNGLQAKFSRELEQHREKVTSRAREREEREREKLDGAAQNLQVGGSGLPLYWRGVERGREHERVVLPTLESQTHPISVSWPQSRTQSRPLFRPRFRSSPLATLPSPRLDRHNRIPSRPPTRHNRNDSGMGRKGRSTRWSGRREGGKNRESVAACFDALIALTPSQSRRVHVTLDCAHVALALSLDLNPLQHSQPTPSPSSPHHLFTSFIPFVPSRKSSVAGRHGSSCSQRS